MKREAEVVLCRIDPAAVAGLVELPVQHHARRQDRELEGVLDLGRRRCSNKFLEVASHQTSHGRVFLEVLNTQFFQVQVV